ncbi:hypothetical protein TSAR_008233 [Trichomalopsis sarcophagae]|uniref:Uncharacterized protein n=1 Tax=Trichomalopsis sarcophagae TaxID=543379 RepID=A0A232FN89_9HYME|nr:hypothetical protein TSAR_008233 [Trichomalopsis sarcophagae]
MPCPFSGYAAGSPNCHQDSPKYSQVPSGIFGISSSILSIPSDTSVYPWYTSGIIKGDSYEDIYEKVKKNIFKQSRKNVWISCKNYNG